MLNTNKLNSDIQNLFTAMYGMETQYQARQYFAQTLTNIISDFVKSGTVTIPPGTQVQVDPVTGIGTTISGSQGSIS